MAVLKYKKYKISLNPETSKTQGLKMGDIVRRQYGDAKKTTYSLMCVLNSGVDTNIVNGEIVEVPYFIGALLDGDELVSSELLDFARITNLYDLDRSGFLYLAGSDSGAPFIDVVDGIGRNKSFCWPTGLSTGNAVDSENQYVVVRSEERRVGKEC